MKTLNKIKIAIIGMLSMLFLTVAPRAEAKPVGAVSFQLFYDQLAPYGEWVNDYEYGYIWLPDAGPNFMPYSSNGYWVMTQYGNTWVSNYDWGWAPFHYGRWFHTDYYGWAWVPDYEWGPAWVSWRHGNGHYGWAPLGPRMSIHVRINIPSHHWVFVPNRYILSPTLHRYYVPRRNHVRIYNRTTIINNTYVYNNKTYISGPSRGELERVTRSRVNVRQINNTAQPTRSSVDSRSVNLYRPAIDQTTRTAARPSRVTDAETVRSRATAGNGAAVQPRSTATRGNNTAVQPRNNTTASGNNTAVQPRSTTTRSAQPAARTEARPAAGTTANRSATRTVESRAAQPAARTQSSGTATRAATPSRSTTQSRATTQSRPAQAQPQARSRERSAVSSSPRAGNSRATTGSGSSRNQTTRSTNGTTRGSGN